MRRKYVKMPDILQRIGLWIMVFSTSVMLFMTLVGLMIGNTEMTIVGFIIAAVSGTLAIFVRRKFKAYYEETADYFLLQGHIRGRRREDRYIYYENITDWVPLYKKMAVLDKTSYDTGTYV